ncbi:MAG: hypothetical protein RIB97_06920 [Nitratireductor sp.]
MSVISITRSKTAGGGKTPDISVAFLPPREKPQASWTVVYSQGRQKQHLARPRNGSGRTA